MSTHSDLKARSPWASLQGIKSLCLSPPESPIKAGLRIPGSKSFTNRALIIAASAKGTSILSGILQSDDSYWCIDTLKKLGVSIDVAGDVATIKGTDAAWLPAKDGLYIGAAGTTARFLPGVLAAAPTGNWLLEGSERLKERPLDDLIQGLRSLGASLSTVDPGKSFPLRISGGGLRGGDVTVSGKISSQFLSGILIASPLANAPVKISVIDGIVQPSYIDMTLSLMRAFGAAAERDDALTQIAVSPTRYCGQEIALEADASTSCYFLAIAALTGGTIKITNLGYSTSQPDIKMVDVLERMGCKVTRTDSYVEVTGVTKKLTGGFTMSMREMSDQALTLAVLASFADAPVTITEVAHIRHHECDRIQAICALLNSAGVQVAEHEDGLTIDPEKNTIKEITQPFPSYDDHRIAMSLSLLSTRMRGLTILDPGCVSKTCPNYFEMLKGLGFKVVLSNS